MKGIMVTYQSVVMSQKRFVDLTAIRAKMRYLLTPESYIRVLQHDDFFTDGLQYRDD